MAQADILDYVRTLNRWKRFIVGVVATAAVASIAISFILPKWYAARSTLIPPQSENLAAGLSALMQGISLPGFGSVTPPSADTQLFMAILDSRTVREQLIKEFNLMPVYRARTLDDALRTHRSLASVRLTDQGVVEVVVEDRDPRRAADMANAWVRDLDTFNKNVRMTAGKKSRLFLERQLEETRRALEQAEDTLTAYQRANKNAPLSAELAAAVQAGSQLLARRLALQVRLNAATDLYQESAPQVVQLHSELAALDRQIDSLPPLTMQYARLLRDLKVQEQVFALLVGQYEEAKIREARDVPTVEILDAATVPQRRSRPIRWLFCTSITLAAVILSVGTAFVAEFVRRLGETRDDPRSAASGTGSTA